MQVKFKKLHPNAVTPNYAKPGDSCVDLVATSKYSTAHWDEYGTSLALEIPDNHVGLIFPRSSISNRPQYLTNHVAVIDSKYRGEIKLRFKKVFDHRAYSEKSYEIGERIAQLMIIPYPIIEFEEVSELSNTERGEGGFGSTNSKKTN
jgi:dUTP pyrophosphatase